MKNYALVERSSGKILNRIVIANPGDWTPPATAELVEETSGAMEIGGTFIAGSYTPPVRETPPPLNFDPLDSWDAISLKIAFNHENRIRALEGKAAMTVAQFKGAVKAQL